MSTVTFELPESLKAHVDERLTSGHFPNLSAYLQTLIAIDRRRAEIDRALLEGENDYERGEYSEWKPGDTRRMWEEMKQKRRAPETP